MSQPFVSIVLPCLNEEGFIEECVRHAQEQDYPADRFEILVADGGSTDRTREIVARLSAADPRVRMVDNPGRYQSAGMNEALRVARGDVIVRMDVHADYAPDYVSKSIAVLLRTGADNAGGAARARSKSFFQRALCAALDSPLAVGGSRYRNPDNEGWVETVWNGAFRRRVFEDIGMYDPKAITNEDAELNQRIHDAGGRVYLSKEILTWYYPRDTLKGLARQYFKYGHGRARTLLKHGKFLSVRPAIPFFMVVGGSLLVATSWLQPFTPWAFGAYALGTLAEAVRVGRSAGPASIPVVWLIFPVLHASHGLGFGAGLWHYWRKPDWRPEGDEKLPKRP
jgi:cellulose synthase/poly-beta-1,6-N-acetylglucosamine synthase-like glycosyltransferase